MPRKILVVDDAAEIRDVLANLILRPSGYEVETATDGAKALASVRAGRPDLVISDIKMPALDGLALVQSLKHEAPGLPVILITAEGSEEMARQALRAGVADYFPKPFDPDEMLASIERALSAREHQDRRVTELETLISLGRTVSQPLELEVVLARVVDAAVTLIGAEESTLLLVDGETGELTVRAAKNLDEKVARTLRLRSDDSLAGQVIKTGQPVRLDERSPQKIVTAYLVQSLLYVPLQVSGRRIGVLGVDNRLKRASFDDHSQQLLQALADEAAIAIEKAGLYAAVERERTQLFTILNETEDGVIVIDHDDRLILVNHTARGAFDVGEAVDVTGQPLRALIKSPELSDLLSRPKRASDIPLADGRTYSAHVTPIANVGRAVILLDVTQQKKLEKIKADFVTTVSHDLRSPLTAVLGYVNLLDRVGPLNEQQTEFIGQIRISVQQMNRLISDLLDLGKIEAGFDQQKETVDTDALIAQVLEDHAPQAMAKQQTLTHDVRGPLPALFGNPFRLKQMLVNLIENSIKYTPEGGRIHLSAYAEGEFIVLVIADTGIGIAPADLPYVFDKFYRSDAASLSQFGTGLGLSIVKSIVDNHEGRIWVNSRQGQGTTFTVMLPQQSAVPASLRSREAAS
jgi:two-component system NtrC family sensor kinase